MNARDPLASSLLRHVDQAWQIDTDEELHRFHASAEPAHDRTRIIRWGGLK